MKYEELKDEIKAAMKAHDNVRRDILRQVHGEIKNIEVNERREVTDADVDAMLKRVIKQTSETLEGSIKAANNDERTAMLKEQVEILEGYLPKQLAGDELVALVEKTIGRSLAPPPSAKWARLWVRLPLPPAETSTRLRPPRKLAAACRSWRSTSSNRVLSIKKRGFRIALL